MKSDLSWPGRVCVAGLLLILAFGLPATALARAIPNSSTPPGPPAAPISGDLMEFLALVPDTGANRQFVTWGNPEAWARATGIGPVDSLEDVQALDETERDQWLNLMARQTLPPQVLGREFLALGDMKDAYGFDLFDARQTLEVGAPPDMLTIVQAAVEPEGVAEALTASGYSKEYLAGGDLYARGEDYATDLHAPARVGITGGLNRIALLKPTNAGESTIEVARATGIITASAAARFDEIDSLADDASYRALIDSIESTDPSTGTLVSLMILDGPLATDPGIVAADSTAAFEAMLKAYAEEPLSPYSQVGFATFRGEEFTDLGIFLVLASGDDPSYVAQLLNQRMDDYVSLVDGEKLSERWDTLWVGSYQGERNVAYVTVRLKPEADQRLAWAELIARRDFLFLSPGE